MGVENEAHAPRKEMPRLRPMGNMGAEVMKFSVAMKVRATAFVIVEADSAEEAIERANEDYEETGINICHQCSNDIDDPTYGPAFEAHELDE